LSTWLVALGCTKRVVSPAAMPKCFQLMMVPSRVVTVRVLLAQRGLPLHHLRAAGVGAHRRGGHERGHGQRERRGPQVKRA
jgi:hypothetical protein